MTTSTETAMLADTVDRTDYAAIEHQEALFIQRRLRELNVPGVFLDIGAGMPCLLSKTMKLHDEDGWTGVLVDPSPQVVVALQAHYAASERITLVSAVITCSRQEPLWFHDNAGVGLGSVVNGHVEAFTAIGHKFTKCLVQPMALMDLLKFVSRPCSFVNIDAEGLSKNLWCAFPAKSMGVAMACVECQNHERDEAIQHATQQGMEVVEATALDLIFEAK